MFTVYLRLNEEIPLYFLPACRDVKKNAGGSTQLRKYAMQESSSQQEALEELKQLYIQFSSHIVQSQVNSFGESCQSSIGVDIYTPLHSQCELLVSTRGSSGVETEVKAERWSGTERRKRTRMPFGEKGASSLSDYFRTTKSGATDRTFLAQRLEDSTWSHVRSALSFARQGNIVSAKLHSELANNAVIILAHYMSDEDFSVFVQNLERVINASDTKR